MIHVCFLLKALSLSKQMFSEIRKLFHDQTRLGMFRVVWPQTIHDQKINLRRVSGPRGHLQQARDTRHIVFLLCVCFFLRQFLLKKQLNYNAALIPVAQQRNSVIHICILFYILFYYGLSQGIEYNSCAMQQHLVIYPFYISQFASVNFRFPIHHFPHPTSPLVTTTCVPDPVSVSQISSFVKKRSFKVDFKMENNTRSQSSRELPN